MLRFTALFAAGTLLFHQLAWLPGWPLLLLAGVVATAASWRPATRPLVALSLGFAWSHLYALSHVPPRLPGDDAVMRLQIEGEIVSLVDRARDPVRFVFRANHVEGPDGALQGSWMLRLNWYDAPQLRPGDRWRLPVRLRAAHGFASPGAWDYEGWLYWQGIRYTGYVSADAQPRSLQNAHCCRLTRLRGSLSAAIDAIEASPFARGVIRAITVGDRAGLDGHGREILRQTGTSHLMAISGLHVGLLAGFGALLTGALWRRLPGLGRRMPARIAATRVGLLAAAGYAVLAGLGLPTQRALIMLTVLAVVLGLRRRGSPLHALALAALLVLAWHPPSILAAGFWLSFGAVLTIIAATRRLQARPPWQRVVLVQLALTLALWPALAVFGLPASTAAPLANLVLVPLFGLLVVPFSLLGVAMLPWLPAAGTWLLQRLGGLLDLIGQGLAWLAALPWPDLSAGAMPWPLVVLVVAAVLLLLAPPGVPLRGLAWPLLAVAWLPREPTLAHGDFELFQLDVGQGLATVVVTRHHTLVFDSGPAYPSGFATAEAVVLPFLDTLGRTVIDRLVLSHGDKDHAGGVDRLLARRDVRELLSGEPHRVGFGALPCAAGMQWRWDGVDFVFVHPARGESWSGNNASCVLRVSNAAGSALLTGDIEERVERHLAATFGRRLRSDIVVAPHHGSRSSSSAALVAATDAKVVVYSAGWGNRYGFPAQSVADRWQAAGTCAYDTVSGGTLAFRFGADGRLSGAQRHRLAARRFWWHDGGSAPATHAVSSPD